jgi:hypothetical protein
MASFGARLIPMGCNVWVKGRCPAQKKPFWTAMKAPREPPSGDESNEFHGGWEETTDLSKIEKLESCR